ncbi:Pao retrotransposon peptidase family protein [Dirofilaria immitis]|nr:Pao retrotransposon peptidase family protein [Dirofilaria immitis]
MSINIIASIQPAKPELNPPDSNMPNRTTEPRGKEYSKIKSKEFNCVWIHWKRQTTNGSATLKQLPQQKEGKKLRIFLSCLYLYSTVILDNRDNFGAALMQHLPDIEELQSGHMLVQSKVGPMIIGNGDIDKLCKNNKYPSKRACPVNVNINFELEKLWKLETIGIQESPNADDDDQALKQFKQTTIKQEGKCQTCWPWKDSKQKLSDSYKLCLGRLKSLIRRLQLQSLLQTYNETIKEQHQSAHHKGFKSLNEALYRCPVLLPDLVGILLRCRMMNTVITADIEKAFL